LPPRARTVLIGLAVLGALTASCGKPPELRNPGSPQPTVSAGSGSAEPAPPVAHPAPSLPVYTPPTVAPRTTTGPAPSRTTAVPPAPRCGSSPTATQILTVVAGSTVLPPGAPLRVLDGPYCAGGWQYTVVAAGTEANPEKLVAVTRGPATTLTVVELGSDVCSESVDQDAPAGIRVLACGS
jgi:hypothetical protein